MYIYKFKCCVFNYNINRCVYIPIYFPNVVLKVKKKYLLKSLSLFAIQHLRSCSKTMLSHICYVPNAHNAELSPDPTKTNYTISSLQKKH